MLEHIYLFIRFASTVDFDLLNISTFQLFFQFPIYFSSNIFFIYTCDFSMLILLMSNRVAFCSTAIVPRDF